MKPDLPHLRILIRGAGEMATGTGFRLHRSGFTRILMTEIAEPLAIRRLVCFSEAVYEGSCSVEGLRAVAISRFDEAQAAWDNRSIPVIVDPSNACLDAFKPDVVVDAILAKKNLGTSINDAPLVIGFGPGFCANCDVHFVVETNRGHNLGRLIQEGMSEPDTGTPGVVGGESAKRVVRSPADGTLSTTYRIGTMVERGEVIGKVDGAEVTASLSGVLRGLIRPGIRVERGLKIGDVDPRGNPEYCSTISEKARAIGGTVLEAILMRNNT
jgi:xanthine dehydrogenase accessory factor